MEGAHRCRRDGNCSSGQTPTTAAVATAAAAAVAAAAVAAAAVTVWWVRRRRDAQRRRALPRERRCSLPRRSRAPRRSRDTPWSWAAAAASLRAWGQQLPRRRYLPPHEIGWLTRSRAPPRRWRARRCRPLVWAAWAQCHPLRRARPRHTWPCLHAARRRRATRPGARRALALSAPRVRLRLRRSQWLWLGCRAVRGAVRRCRSRSSSADAARRGVRRATVRSTWLGLGLGLANPNLNPNPNPHPNQVRLTTPRHITKLLKSLVTTVSIRSLNGIY